MSNVDVTNPDVLDLSTLTRTFYAFKQNYYLGTGELIKSDVLDTVEGRPAINTTNYYYSSAVNFVKEVDAKDKGTVLLSKKTMVLLLRLYCLMVKLPYP